MVPMVLSQIVPSACLISCLYSLGTLSRHNEIIAMKSNGISGFRILMPILYVGILISVLLFCVNEAVTPNSAIASVTIKQGLIDKNSSENKTISLKNVAMLAPQNRMIYARELKPGKQMLHDVIVLEHRNDLSLKSKSTAEHAVYDGERWMFYEVMEYRLDPEGNMIQKPSLFPKKDLGITASPREFLKQHIEPALMSYRQLKRYLDHTTITGYKASKRLLMELHQKLSRPLVPFLMLLLAAPLALRIQRGGAMISMGAALFIMVIFYSVTAFVSALGRGGVLPPLVAAWLPNAVFLLVGVYLVRKYI